MIQTTVSTVKDPTSDMAVNARNGSNLLRDVREKRDQMKMVWFLLSLMLIRVIDDDIHVHCCRGSDFGRLVDLRWVIPSEWLLKLSLIKM